LSANKEGNMAIWLIWAFLIVAALCGLLGYVLLPAPKRGFAKVLFYIFLLAAIVAFIFYYWAPRSVPPQPLPTNAPPPIEPVGH
jgi:uncharacterized membrane protein YfcA